MKFKIFVAVSLILTGPTACAAAVHSSTMEFDTQQEADYAFECLIIEQTFRVLKLYPTLTQERIH